MLQQLLAQLGGGGPGGVPGAGVPGEEAGMPEGGMSPDVGTDWLTTAINAVHSGMVQEGDPKQVSLLGAILNQLTTFQANAMGTGGASGG